MAGICSHPILNCKTLNSFLFSVLLTEGGAEFFELTKVYPCGPSAFSACLESVILP